MNPNQNSAKPDARSHPASAPQDHRTASWRGVLQELALLAKSRFDVSTVWISSVNGTHVHNLASAGTPSFGSLPLESSLCARTLQLGRPVTISDIESDPEWAVQTMGYLGQQPARFYASHPLGFDRDHKGTLSLLDSKPHDFSPRDAEDFTQFARLADTILEFREPAESPASSPNGDLTICAWTKKIRHGQEWITIEDFLETHLHYRLTHGISEEAMKDLSNQAENITHQRTA